MKIFIIGASGRVGEKLTKELLNNGHQVVTGSRHEKDLVENDNLSNVHLDLHDDVTALSKIIKGVDAIYFVAGSRSKDLLQTDAFGAVKVMQVAKLNNINRFIMLSSAYSLDPDTWNKPIFEGLMDYNIAKFFADNYLVNQTNLDYTILQATSLTDTIPTNDISLDEKAGIKNSIGNVAKTLAQIIENDNTIKRIIKMSDGDTPIKIAISNIK